MEDTLEKTTYQANELIECCKNFNVQEMRLFYLGLQGLFPELPRVKGNSKIYHDVEFKPIIIDTSTLINLFGGNTWYYTELKKTCDKLLGKIFHIKNKKDNNEKSYDAVTVFSRITMKNGELTIKFNAEMKPYLLELANRPFTKIKIKEMFNLKSEYAMQLLELILQYRNSPTRSRTLSVEDLRKHLGIKDTTYKKMADFRRYVLDKPLEEIKNNSDFDISYEKIKKGRKIVAFEFKLNSKDNYDVGTDQEDTGINQGDIGTDPDNEIIKSIKKSIKEEMAADTKEELNSILEGSQEDTRNKFDYTVDNLKFIGIDKDTAIKLAKKFSYNRIEKNVLYAKKKDATGEIKDLSAYAIMAISKDYAKADTQSEYDKEKVLKKELERKNRQSLKPEFSQNEDTEIDPNSVFAKFMPQK